ncbi:MAG: Lrp/AsnC family transcriptional regulator [bacterium]|nr:Lrp/AsnC family transcriptional regulator [bacterium]
MSNLLELEPIKEFIGATGEKVASYFGKENACIVYLRPDGAFYGVGLYDWLKEKKKKKNIVLTTMEDDGEGLEEEKLKKRKVLVVDNDIITGKGYKRSLEALRLRKSRLGIKDIKFAVYSDRIGLADFSVGKYAAETVWRLDIIDALDLKIMRYLIQNGRASFADIGKKVNLSAVAVSNRVEKLIKEKAFKIQGGLVIDQFYTMSAHIQVEAEPKALEKLIEVLEHSPEICRLVKMSGKQTLNVDILVRSLHHIEDFIANKIHAVPGSKRVDVTIGELPIVPKIYFPSL